MGRLSNRTAVITGAGKGIGEAIARRFLEEDIRGLALMDFDQDLVRATAKRLDPTGKQVIPLHCDVSDQQQVVAACERAYGHFGSVDILVNNAGITRDMMFHKMTDAAWDAVLRVNLDGTYRLCRQILPHMRAQGYGKIVNLSSVSAFGNAGQSNYAASKAAVIGLTKTLALESAQKNITVNAVAPGFIQTDILDTIPEKIMQQFIETIPMHRLGDADEVASVVAFLSSDDSSFLTGQVLIVSGGTNL